MRLRDAARFFDRTPLVDAYTEETLRTRIQFGLFDDSKRDGVTSLRRVMSMAAGSEIPSRRVALIGEQPWLIGVRQPDVMGGTITRDRYVLHMADTTLARLCSVEDLLEGRGRKVYASRVWVKDVKDISTTSEGQSQYVIFFSRGEPVVEGGFVMASGRIHLVRNLIEVAGGFIGAECNELEPDCLQEFECRVGTYHPLTEQYTYAPTALSGVVSRYLDDYEHELPSYVEGEVGDVRVRFFTTHLPVISTETLFEHSGKLWKVVSIDLRPASSQSVVLRRLT